MADNVEVSLNGGAVRAMDMAVLERYRIGAEQKVEALCCPVSYDKNLLSAIPLEIIEKDYGCGDPSQFVRAGETVLDLGSDGGKIAYMAAQIVGAAGRIIGVDFNPAMLALSRKYKGEFAAKVGFDVVEFRRGRIQDLALDLDLLDRELAAHPIRSADDLQWLADISAKLKREKPLIPTESVDMVLSNCVLNLVGEAEKHLLFSEIFRVTRNGGRVAISDIVSDKAVPAELKADPELWSGCISGAFKEESFLKAFEDAGFYGIELAKRDEKPWRTVSGIEFRAVTVTAHKGKQGPSAYRNHSVIYKGPFKAVEDDDGHVLARGVRQPVNDITYRLFSREPYASDFILIDPRVGAGNNQLPADENSCCAPGCCSE